MTIAIYVVAIVMWILLFKWTWNSTKSIDSDKTRKMYIIICTLFVGIITLIDICISKSGVVYPKVEMFKPIKRILFAFFTPVNGFIVMPYLAIQIGKIDTDQIDNDKFKKNIKILLIIFIMVLIVECSYFKSIQNGILDIYQK